MNLAYDMNCFEELSNEEMMSIDGGITLKQALNVAAIAISIVGIAMTPYGLLAAVGQNALRAAAGRGVSAVIGLLASVL